jgi:fimbrial chaperone protein
MTLLARAILTLLLAAAAPARAGQIDVKPILVELGPRGRTALVEVRNAGTTPLRVQVRTAAWAQDAAGAVRVEPTTELLAFPPLLGIAPGTRRNVRVGTELAPGPVERSFRVFLEELPPPADAGAAEVRVLTRISIPVFLAPAAPVVRAVVAPPAVSAGRLTALLRNEGNARFRPSAVRLVVRGAAGGPLLEQDLEGWYVLAGGERRYEVALGEAVCTAARAAAVTATVTATLDTVEVKASAPIPPGACGP